MHTSMARIAVIVLLLATLVVTIPAQAQVKGCLPGVAKKVPVLFVHGFNGKPADWEDKVSLKPILDKIPELLTAPFDYSNYNTRWVTDENIGPKLAQRIACIAQSSREEGGKGKVIVIGHSMGGLAAQFAANQKVNGGRVADDIGLAIPIGSPFAGSQLADWTMTLARAYCSAQHITLVGGKTIRGNPDKCEAMVDTYTAIGGLRQDSAKLRELPPFPPDVPVHTIAGNVQEAKFNIFGVELKPLNSDLVVTTDSATKGNAHPSHGGGKSIVDCVSVWPIPGFSDASCDHGRLLTDKNVQTQVVDAINQYLRRAKLDESGARFIGEWRSSADAILTFDEDETGKLVLHMGTCFGDVRFQCQATVNFTWQPTPEGASYTVSSIGYTAVIESGEVIPADGEVDISEFVSVGMTLDVVLRSPGMIERDPGGIHNWMFCKYELATPEEKQLCG